MVVDITDEWERDFDPCRSAWADSEEVEGFAGMVATISGESSPCPSVLAEIDRLPSRWFRPHYPIPPRVR